MEKKKLNENKSGFTLIEILAVIVIISLLFSIGFYYFNNVINKSEDASENITYNNIKMSAHDYAIEYYNDAIWNSDAEICVSIQTLVAKGFLDKEILEDDKVPKAIIVKKDEDSDTVSEKINDNIDCPTYEKTVKVPKSSEICENSIYNGTPKNLLIEGEKSGYNFNYADSIYDKNDENKWPINAGKYKIKLTLITGKIWEDGTDADKYITCTMKKAEATVGFPELDENSEIENLRRYDGGSGEKIETIKKEIRSNVSGSIEIKSSNSKHVTAKVDGANNELENYGSVDYPYGKKIDITTHSTRNTTTYVTITVKPNDEDAKNYTKSSATYVVGKITEPVKVNVVTSDLCNKNNVYNGGDIVLYEPKEDDPFIISNNIGRYIGEYVLSAELKYGYIWSDGTSDIKEFTCSIIGATPTISYKNAPNCIPNKIVVTYGKEYGKDINGNYRPLCAPTKNGYKFQGWYLDDEYMNEVTDNTIVKNPDDHDLYSEWNANTYTINYDCNGGTGTIESVETKYDENIELSENRCSRTGYTFDGWIGPKETYQAKQLVTNLTYVDGGVVTLKAKWKANKYTINYNCNYGTGSTPSSTHEYGVAKKLSPNGCTKTGYSFSEWSTSKSSWSWVQATTYTDQQSVINLTDKNNETITLYAKWTKSTTTTTPEEDEDIVYTVKYDCNGGTGTMSSTTHTYGVMSSLRANACIKSGSTFKNWNTSKSGIGTSYNNRAYVSNLASTNGATVTLYAQWTTDSTTTPAEDEDIVYTVKYDCNGGTGTTASSTHVYGVSSRLNNNACTKSGSTFKNWNTSKSGIGTSYSNRAYVSNLASTNGATVTLYAQWTANSTTTPEEDEDIVYTVKYDSNGGTGTMSSSTHVYGEAKRLNANKFTKSGSSFNGWNTKADGSGTSYSDEQSVTNLTSTNGATVTLYAKWSSNPSYTISYAMNNGTKGSNAPTSAKVGEQFTISNPTKTIKIDIDKNGTGATLSASSVSKAQTFAGWTSSSDAGLNTSTAMSGGAAWSGTATKNTTFKNLRSSSGTVTMTATWTPVNFTLPTATKANNECTFNTKADGSGTTYTPGNTYKPSSGGNSRQFYVICKSTFSVSVTNEKYLICPEDREIPTRSKCTQNGETSCQYNSVYVGDVSVSGTTVKIPVKLHMNNSATTWLGSNNDRTLCLANTSGTCKKTLKSFQIKEGWASPGSNPINKTFSVDVSSLAAGSYRIIVAGDPDADQSTDNAKRMRFKTTSYVKNTIKITK